MTVATDSTETVEYAWKATKGPHAIEVRATSGDDWTLDTESVIVDPKKKSSDTPGFEAVIVAAAALVVVAIARRKRL